MVSIYDKGYPNLTPESLAEYPLVSDSAKLSKNFNNTFGSDPTVYVVVLGIFSSSGFGF